MHRNKIELLNELDRISLITDCSMGLSLFTMGIRDDRTKELIYRGIRFFDILKDDQKLIGKKIKLDKFYIADFFDYFRRMSGLSNEQITDLIKKSEKFLKKMKKYLDGSTKEIPDKKEIREFQKLLIKLSHPCLCSVSTKLHKLHTII